MRQTLTPAQASVATLAAILLAAFSAAPASATNTGPRIVDTRIYRIVQTVTLKDVPASARKVRLWVPIPADGPWQHVLDRRVVEAPAGWALTHEDNSDADLIVATTKGGGSVSVVVETRVMRQSPAFDMSGTSGGEVDPTLFTDELRTDAPLMLADKQVMAMAVKACANESDPKRKAILILDAVADAADHYSKDASKPKCSRGSAQDCLAHGGGCCTDLHSLFIAAARSAGIPARIEFGYRLNPAKEGTEYDPSYRCWVEYALPGMGWVPTDLVVADAGDASGRLANYGTLDARRVWLWQGRSLVLEPKQSAPPIQTMISGWAEIDGKPVDVLPAADGTPSKLSRMIRFEDLTPKLAASSQ